MVTELEILTKARALIATPETWCKGTFAQNKAGVGINESREDACRFCALGAINRVTYELANQPQSDMFTIYSVSDNAISKFLRIAAAEVNQGNRHIIHVNDNLGHEATLKMFDRAIELAKEAAAAAKT